VDAKGGYIALMTGTLDGCVPKAARLEVVDVDEGKIAMKAGSGFCSNGVNTVCNKASQSESTTFKVKCLSGCSGTPADTSKNGSGDVSGDETNLISVNYIPGASLVCIVPEPVSFAVSKDGTYSLVAKFSAESRCNPMGATRIFGNVLSNSKVVGTVVVEVEPGSTLRIWNTTRIEGRALTVDLKSTVFFPTSMLRGKAAPSCKTQCFPSIKSGTLPSILKVHEYACVKFCEPKDESGDGCACTMAKRIMCRTAVNAHANSVHNMSSNVLAVGMEARSCSQEKVLVSPASDSPTTTDYCKVDCALQLATF